MDGSNTNSQSAYTLISINNQNYREEDSKSLGSATLKRLKHKDKSIKSISVEKYGTHHAIILFNRELVKEIEHPEEWLFLIEGTSWHESNYRDINVIVNISKQKNIPIFDPYYSVHHLEVVKKYFQTGETSEFIQDVVINELTKYVMYDWEGLHSLNQVAEMLNVESIDMLEGIYRRARALKVVNEFIYNEQAKAIQQGLILTSNIISKQVIDYCLKIYPGKFHVLMYMQTIYKNIFNISQEDIEKSGLLLSNAEIENLLNDRYELRLKRAQLIKESIEWEVESKKKKRIKVIKKFITKKFLSKKEQKEDPAERNKKIMLEAILETFKKKPSYRVIDKILDTLPSLSEDLKEAIKTWVTDKNFWYYVESNEENYIELLKSKDLAEIEIGLRGMLIHKIVNVYASERKLHEEEKNEIGQIFLKLSKEYEDKMHFYEKEKEELEKIRTKSNNNSDHDESLEYNTDEEKILKEKINSLNLDSKRAKMIGMHIPTLEALYIGLIEVRQEDAESIEEEKQNMKFKTELAFIEQEVKTQ